jgi:hypothetical protein
MSMRRRANSAIDVEVPEATLTIWPVSSHSMRDRCGTYEIGNVDEVHRLLAVALDHRGDPTADGG